MSEQVDSPPVLTGPEAERVRRRVRLLVEITSRVAVFRTGLRLAARRLTRAEATIIDDLERHGLDVPQLREVLWGGHVLVDNPGLYARWRFPKTHQRLSSHHKDIDKHRYPDLGLKGPLVREKLHGRTADGTWIQLEKTPAALGDGFRLPTLNDFWHLCDYVVYRITRSNVGPWGRSSQTERRPVYLSPTLSAVVPLAAAAREELTGALERAGGRAGVASASPDLAGHFPPPHRRDTLAELVLHPGTRHGRGLFGSSGVCDRSVRSPAARALLERAGRTEPAWSLPDAAQTRTDTVRGGDREIRCAVRQVPADREQQD